MDPFRIALANIRIPRSPEDSLAQAEDAIRQAMLCRAAENTCFFASVNCAGAGAATTSAIVRPNGTLMAYQPYGQEGLLVADLHLDEATGLLARRFRGT
jgi:predicted amidohydrolase